MTSHEGTRLRLDPAGVSIARRRAMAATAGLGVMTAGWLIVAGQAVAALPPIPIVVARALAFIEDLFGGSPVTTTSAQTATWIDVAGLALDTATMSVLAMGLAGVGSLLTLTPASRHLMVQSHGRGSRFGSRIVVVVFRSGHAILRATPELIWAMLIIFVVRPGILAGALALALHETGVLGRLSSDVVDDVDRAPITALRTSGASPWQVFAFGALPAVLPQLVTFLLYRWEVVLRATVVVGFVTGAGLGYGLRLAMAYRRWSEVGLILAAYIVLVWLAELAAVQLRRLVK